MVNAGSVLEELRPKTILFCALVAVAMALSVLLRGRRKVHWQFAGFSTAVALWYASQSLAGFFRDEIWIRATGVLTVTLPQLAALLFQNIAPPEGNTKSFISPRTGFLLGLPVLALVVSPYNQRPYALFTQYVYVFGMLVAALVSLAKHGQASPSRAIRQRVRFLVVVGALAVTTTLFDFVSYLGVQLAPVAAVLSIVFLFVLAESATRPRLADMYEMAWRFVSSAVLASFLALLFFLFVSVLGGFSTQYLNAILAATVFLVLFEPLRDEVESRMHRFFLRERFDFETNTLELRKKLAHVFEVDVLVSILFDALEASRRVTSAALFVRDADGDGFDRVGALGASVPARIESLVVRPLLDSLEGRPSLVLEDLAREGDKESSAITAASTALLSLQRSIVLSVRGDDGVLLGLLLVADDRIRDAFTPEEVALLEGLSAQLGVVLANCRVYTRMKDRDRLAALGSMAAGLAHEVKNPLGAIKGAAQLLEEEISETHEAPSREFVGIILEEVERLNRIVSSFLDYARPQSGTSVPVDINAVVKRTIQILMSQRVDDAVDIDMDFAQDLPRVSIDPEKLRQVLMNLVQNAVQAMDGRGRVTVTTSARLLRTSSASGPASERSLATAAATDVEISVRDTGPGISPRVRKNLFVPFFTTKVEGTGLGLAISQSIVQSAGGRIDVESQAGAGTRFTIVLPVGTNTVTPLPGSSLSERPSAMF